MRRIILVMAILFLMAAGPPPSPEAAFRAARADYWQAFERGDTAAMAKSESKDLRVFHDRAAEMQPQDAWLRDIRVLAEAKKWRPKRPAPDKTEVSVRVTGGAASVSGVGEVLAVEPGPREYKAFTEVWVRREGRWLLVHLHYDFRKDKDAP